MLSMSMPLMALSTKSRRMFSMDTAGEYVFFTSYWPRASHAHQRHLWRSCDPASSALILRLNTILLGTMRTVWPSASRALISAMVAGSSVAKVSSSW